MPWYNVTLGIAMLAGRFLMIVPILALAGSLARKKRLAETSGTFPTTGPLWIGLLAGVIVIVGALTYFPAYCARPDHRALRHAPWLDLRQLTADTHPVLQPAVAAMNRSSHRGCNHDRGLDFNERNLVPKRCHGSNGPRRSNRRRNNQSGGCSIGRLPGRPSESHSKSSTRASLAQNPVMFIVEIGAAITTVILVQNLLGRGDDETWFVAAITIWLWFTVLFANFAEAMAEGRGKAQAATLRKTRSETMAKVMIDGDRANIALRSSGELQLGDLVLVETGDIIPGDGEVIHGIAYVSEAAITGESAPVLKEPGTDICVVGHRRHAGRLGRAGRAHHHRTGQELSRPHDRPGRGRGAAEDAQ